MRRFLILVIWAAFMSVGGTARADEPLDNGLGGSSVASSTPTNIRLRVYSATSTLFDGEVGVSACAASASSSPASSGYCAIQQSGLVSSWSSFGDARFLDVVDGVASDSEKGWYWGWFSDLDYGQTSLDQHQVVEGEDLMVIIGRMPLKVALSTTTPDVGSTTTVAVYEFGFDDSWNGVWTPSSSSTLSVADAVAPSDGSGVYGIFISTSTPFGIIARREGFLDSAAVVVAPIEVFSGVATTTPVSEVPSEMASGGSSAGGHQGACMFDLERAFGFIESKQRADGSFGSSLYGDWSAIALAAGSRGSSLDRLKANILEDHGPLSTATDYERRAMALMSLGVNPYDGTSVDYIQHIVDCFDGSQVGDSSLVNDDIFSLFPLLGSGYSSGDAIVRSIVAFILSQQSDDGSWGSIDLTASAIQSLSRVSDIGGVNDSLNRARSYLVSRQRDDGGFGSSFSTSWALQSIVALGENGSAWVKPGGSPLSSLCLAQADDGGVGTMADDENSRLWATAYAVPAVMGKTWPAITRSFSRVSHPPVAPAVSVAEPSINVVASSSVASTTFVIVAPDSFVAPKTIESVPRPVPTPLVAKPADAPIIALTTPAPYRAVGEVSVAAVAESGLDVSPWLIATAGIALSAAVLYVIRRASPRQ